LSGLHLVIYGVLMILVMIFYPDGLAGIWDWLLGRIRGRS
jgi:ABC-type branched-subunit amino acid transport system permease subunit